MNLLINSCFTLALLAPAPGYTIDVVGNGVKLTSPVAIASPQTQFDGAPPATMTPEEREFARFSPEIEAIQERDRGVATVNGGTLFIGSSSIRNWDVAACFPHSAPINRGFGGAAIPDVLHYYAELLSVYRPSAVVVYVGENDLARGEAPARVAKDILTLLDRLRADLPQARIVYLSLKAGTTRWFLWPKMEAVNAEIRARASTVGDFDYLDVATPLQIAGGKPDDRLFLGDHIHLNAKGYAVWTAIVDAYLEQGSPPAQLNIGDSTKRTRPVAPVASLAASDQSLRSSAR